MHQVTIACCLALVILVGWSEGMELRPRTTSSTVIPPRRERLPYTPVRNSTRKERLPYTPVKPTTLRPGMLNRISTTTKRVPFPTKTTVKPSNCNCNCNVTDYKPICAEDGSDRDTFANRCQLDCFNCTLNKRYRVVSQGECSR